MSYELQPYNPSAHANAAPQYNQSHVVVGNVPLTKIEYDPRDDKIAEFVGHRVPGGCPDFEDLAASAKKPPIQGAEQKQHLRILCLYRTEVTADVTAYPMCTKKAAQLSLDFENIPSKWLTSEREKYNLFRCPFMHLGGAIIGQNSVRVEVALDAYDPFDLPPLESV